MQGVVVGVLVGVTLGRVGLVVGVGTGGDVVPRGDVAVGRGVDVGLGAVEWGNVGTAVPPVGEALGDALGDDVVGVAPDPGPAGVVAGEGAFAP